jgi:plasmid stabilization system protein ParE
MTYRVIISPEAKAHLGAIYHYIATASSSSISARYTEGIVNYCYKLDRNPLRGTKRDDLHPGLRITHYKKRATIAFTVNAAIQQVTIIAIFYGGQDYEAILQDDQE